MPLLVIAEFEGRKRGELITDASVVPAILAGPYAHFVVAVADAPASEPAHSTLPDIVED